MTDTQSPLSIEDVQARDAKPKLILIDNPDGSVRPDGSVKPEKTEAQIIEELVEALARIEINNKDVAPEDQEDPGFRYIFARLYPNGELTATVKVDMPTQALQMLSFLMGNFSSQAHAVLIENAMYMAQIAQFNEAMKEAGQTEAPVHPALANGGKVIGSPQPPNRQQAIAHASMAELKRLEDGMGVKVRP